MSKKRTNGAILFEMVEQAQGFSYISDAIEEENDVDKVLEMAEASLYWHLESAQKLIRFISSRTWNPKANRVSRRTSRTKRVTR